ncbi:MAG: Type 1 glutamine amidotransferase-like domain-containing protein [Oscillospiraceae bacterium]|nr:Type 1 glutamine amidotransferase-like domain-containing protein [Oscillospiraceae bacterium]
MNVLLTSCGLETKAIEQTFLKMLNKAPSQAKAMFVPTAAISPDAIEVLPKCLNDLLKCGIARENIFVCDLHDALNVSISDEYDVIYLCGGDPTYLLRRIREHGFDKELESFINHGGVVVGVSAGSMIFADDMPNNLGLLKCALDVHCSRDTCDKAGQYSLNRTDRIRLGNEQAIVFEKEHFSIIE